MLNELIYDKILMNIFQKPIKNNIFYNATIIKIN